MSTPATKATTPSTVALTATQPNVLIPKRIKNAARNKVDSDIEAPYLNLRKNDRNTPRCFTLVEDELRTDFVERGCCLVKTFFFGAWNNHFSIKAGKVDVCAYVVHIESVYHHHKKSKVT
jgi:hypothetical protein